MMKAFKKITFALLISSVLAFGGLAQSTYNDQKPKDKPKEQPKETPKKGGDERGGKDDKKPRDKKPDSEFFS